MAAYASRADMESEIEGGDVLDNDAMDRYLVRASRDIDRIVGAWGYLSGQVLKFGDLAGDLNPRGLTAVQREAVMRATCYQALYRINLDDARESASGDADEVASNVKSVTGPEFSITYATASEVAKTAESSADRPYRASEEAWAELRGANLIRISAIAV